MDWNFLKRSIFQTSLIALAVSLAIAILTPIPVWIALPVLLFSWPVTDIIIECIASQNPSAHKRITATQGKNVLLTQLTLLAILAFGISAGLKLPYLTGFSATLLVLCPLGSLNSIVAEREDNEKGGFHNPDEDRKE